MTGLLTALQDVIDIQLAEPTVKTDPYMRGMANGMLCAKAVITGEDPVYINKENILRRLREVDFTPEQEKHFEDRTNKHINLVQEKAKMIVDAYPEYEDLLTQVEVHDASKFKEPERTPYISLTWRHKLENEKGEFDPMKDKGYKTPGMLSNEDENQATLFHVRNNEHHPEYWSKADANLDPNDRDKSTKCLDASKMPDLAIAEMISDWAAMSEELGENNPRGWYDKQKDVRWHFSEEQGKLIDKLLKVFEKSTQEAKIQKPDIDPKYLYSIAHKAENVKLIWWYSSTTGEIILSDNPEYTHSHEMFTDVAYKPVWVRGRVFELQGKTFLIIYLSKTKRLSSRQILDLIDKLNSKMDTQIDYVIDSEGKDLSYLLEGIDKSILERFGIKPY